MRIARPSRSTVCSNAFAVRTGAKTPPRSSSNGVSLLLTIEATLPDAVGQMSVVVDR
jgi:hypothetical protein